MLRDWVPQSVSADDPPAVLELMKRVTIIPSHTTALFAPRITIFTRDGKSYTRQGTGGEFIWDFAEQACRVRALVPGLPLSAERFETIIETCAALDAQARADVLIGLTMTA